VIILEFLRLSIHQTSAEIGVQTQGANQNIRSPRGDLSIQQKPANVEMESPAGQLEIDSSAAWAALGVGPHLEWMNSIYSQSKGVVLQAIAKTVEEGNRMAQITNHQDAFADLASRVFPLTDPIDYLGDPSYFNVKVRYTPRAPIINIEPQKAEIQYTPHKPEVVYNPGNVGIYMKQMNSIDIQVSQYDWYK
jgi:hypothetical protein